MTDNTSTEIRLNSSKQPHAPEVRIMFVFVKYYTTMKQSIEI